MNKMIEFVNRHWIALNPLALLVYAYGIAYVIESSCF